MAPDDDDDDDDDRPKKGFCSLQQFAMSYERLTSFVGSARFGSIRSVFVPMTMEEKDGAATKQIHH